MLDSFFTGSRANLGAIADRIRLVEGDVRHVPTVEECASGCDVVFHQAAIVSVPYSVEHPQESHDVNIQGTINVLQAGSQGADPAGRVRVVGGDLRRGARRSPRLRRCAQSPCLRTASRRSPANTTSRRGASCSRSRRWRSATSTSSALGRTLGRRTRRHQHLRRSHHRRASDHVFWRRLRSAGLRLRRQRGRREHTRRDTRGGLRPRVQHRVRRRRDYPGPELASAIERASGPGPRRTLLCRTARGRHQGICRSIARAARRSSVTHRRSTSRKA